ncbi:hypothetical protein MAPG_05712 [Magnaporthiopsis poae ATCC 64411]|uniref:Multicopper oxidase n=1 Tax=Magnaporthiopsis poae (strain ATCC 64411 / 73-15) TaxID=644358 RepID=A0A0C4E046_MAGP6|nr:hypothetical protein MAPG_05712 [Magnaporthiopsis poae ATCC 64411]
MVTRGLAPRTTAIIGLVVAINIIVLSLGLKSGLKFRAAPLFGFVGPPNHTRPAPPRLPGLPLQPGTPEEWRLNTDREYLLDMAWDLNAAPTTRRYDFVITQGKAWPDGVVRDMLLVNGQFPGPLIEANRGDRILVNVTNKLASEPTAIHWHGIHQRGTPWFDGTAGVTQCGIPPGQSLLYNFTLDGQFGTFWWHAHYSAQAIDGVLGPLVIHAPEEAALRETYQQDRVLLLQDWYHDTSKVDLAKYLAPNVENNEPIPSSGLINGRNYFDCSRYGPDSGKSCYGNASHSVLSLEPHSRTRLRLINGGAFTSFEFSVDKHPLNVIEADSILTRPHSTNRLPIHVGQRYSAVLDTNQEAGTNYWVRAAMVTFRFKGDENPVLDSTTKAVLSYVGKTDATLTPDPAQSTDWQAEANAVVCKDPEDATLVPLVSKPPPPATRFVAVDFHFAIGANQMSYAKVNETVTWKPQLNSTTLLDAVEGLRSPVAASWSMPAPEGRVEVFQQDQYVVGVSNDTAEVVDLLVYSLDDGSHPFHLHGHDFWIMERGGGAFDWTHYHSEVAVPGPSVLDRPRRDTVTIEPYSWVLVRFVADNPGLWAFHCHMAWHMEAGLLMQFMSGASMLAKTEIPEHIASLCASAG